MKSFAQRQAMAFGMLGMLATLGALSGLVANAWAADPVAPPGTDPGGPAIALIGAGFDYTQPQVHPKLARDGEGLPIGWDVIDGDVTPFAFDDTTSTRTAHAALKSLLNGYASGRVVLVRAQMDATPSLANALGFAIRTPARIVALTDLPEADGVKLITAIAEKAPHVLFVAPGLPGWTDEALDNVVRAAPLTLFDQFHDRKIDLWYEDRYVEYPGMLNDPRRRAVAIGEAVARAAGAAGCVQHGGLAADGAASKRKTLAALTNSWTRSRVKVWLGDCHRDGGKL